LTICLFIYKGIDIGNKQEKTKNSDVAMKIIPKDSENNINMGEISIEVKFTKYQRPCFSRRDLRC